MRLTYEESAALLHKFWSGQSVPSPRTGRPMRAFFVDRSLCVPGKAETEDVLKKLVAGTYSFA